MGYEVVGIPVDGSGAELKSIDTMQQLHLKLPSTRFTDRPFQFSDGEIIKISQDSIITNTSVWKFTVISA